ncbi:efflux RND transporter periplasmic adaptor subunit [Oxalobacteraceae bacterium OM1]|nr:efflux RND transporter periplasmic adaptor subunit [Oxalobacteraceae bacterium OM1]
MRQPAFPSSVSTLRGRRRWIVPAVLAAVLGAGGGTWYVLHSGKPAETRPAQEKKDKPPVYELGESDVAVVDARELRVALPAAGTLTPFNQATVKSKVTAEVREFLVPEGLPVKRGQVVVRLDTADLQARLLSAQAAHDEARAKLALAQKTHASNLALLTQKYISQNAFDAAQNSVELAQAAVKSANSQLQIARHALEDATVRAPFDGIISKRLVQPGEKVAPDTPLYALVDLKELVFEAQVPASEIPRVKVGQDVAFKVDGFAARSFKGKVARINPTTEAGSRAMTVYVAVENRDAALRGGMYAQGSIVLEKSTVMPVLPLAALRESPGKTVVYKVDGGRVVAQPVTVGLRNDDEGVVEVKDGVREGDRIVVAKLDTLKPGSEVKLPEKVKATAEAAASGPDRS